MAQGRVPSPTKFFYNQVSFMKSNITQMSNCGGDL